MFGRKKESSNGKIRLPRTGPELLEAGMTYHKNGSYELAYECFLKGMEKKYIPCQTQMAYLFLDKNYPERDDETAYKLFSASYSAGDNEAGIMMCSCLMGGDGTQQDKSSACYIMGDIAKRTKDARAEVRYAYMLENGFQGPPVMADVAKIYKKTAEKGWAEAQYQMARLYFSGKGVRKAKDKGANLIWKAANQSYQPAMRVLSAVYYYGYGVDKNIEEALKWGISAFQKTPDTIAAYIVGRILNENPQLMPEQPDLAKQLLNMAEKNGIPRDTSENILMDAILEQMGKLESFDYLSD